VYLKGDTFLLGDNRVVFERQKGNVVKLRLDAIYAGLVLKRQL
jgi:hypothetical protein